MRYNTCLPFLLLCAVGLSLSASAQPDVADSNADWIREHYTKQETYIPMRDGIRLFSNIYVPKDKSKSYPILMCRSPYGSAPYGADAYPDHPYPIIDYFKEGYIIVMQDVRGKYMSEGEYVDVRPYLAVKKTSKDIDESTDTYDAIDWMVKNLPGNNGKVGIMGISYPGFYATMSIPDAHPALKAVSPQAPVTDWFMGDDIHHNGAFFLLDEIGFDYYFGRHREKPGTQSEWQHQPALDFGTPDNYKFFLELGPLDNINKKYFKDSIAFWNEVSNHPNLDAFWKARNTRPALKNVRPAVLVVGGLFDAEDCFGAWHTYQAIEHQNPAATSNRIVMGPWSHGQWARDIGEQMGNIHFGLPTGTYYRDSIEKPFFRYYLKGEGNMDLPDANVFFTGVNQWKQFSQWPPAGISSQNLYFQPAGKLGFEQPGTAGAYDEYISDPAKPVPYTEDVHLHRTREYMTDDQRFASRRPDVLVYQTEILNEDITFAGPLNADLFVSTTGSDADFIVKIIDVLPDDTPNDPKSKVPLGGYQMLVRGEVMRARFRNSFEKPIPMTPGKVAEVKFEMPDIAHTFRKGHRIMIQVQSSWFPLVDRNPQKYVANIFHAKASDYQKAGIRLYHAPGKASKVVVKVMK